MTQRSISLQSAELLQWKFAKCMVFRFIPIVVGILKCNTRQSANRIFGIQSLISADCGLRTWRNFEDAHLSVSSYIYISLRWNHYRSSANCSPSPPRGKVLPRFEFLQIWFCRPACSLPPCCLIYRTHPHPDHPLLLRTSKIGTWKRNFWESYAGKLDLEVWRG